MSKKNGPKESPPGNWILENVEEAHARAPDTFRIPSLQERLTACPGTVVRLHFLLQDSPAYRAERLWVRIKQVLGNAFIGELLDTPVTVKELSRGAEVRFDKSHIASILVTKENPLWIDETQHAFVTNRVLNEKRPICFLYREAPGSTGDSGWRAFAGDESEEYLSDPANIQICSLGALLKADESLESVLARPEPVAYERDGPQESFREVQDFRINRTA